MPESMRPDGVLQLMATSGESSKISNRIVPALFASARPIRIMDRHMSLELIRPGEPFLATGVRAHKGPFTRIFWSGQYLPLRPSSCRGDSRVRICFVKLDASTKPLSQCGHTNGFSPLCVRYEE